jgi:RAQPRD family integrative conjugative element protein
MMLKRSLIVSVLTMIAINFSYASTDSRIYLSRVDLELSSVLQNVQKAQQADVGEHVQSFNYQALTADIQTIQKGIQDYINDTRVLPSSIQTLNGHYGENK